jgi:hypothetical protein
MKSHSHPFWRTLCAAFLCSSATAIASDHADPMSLNVLAVMKEPEANITDLHAFIVDGQHKRITSPARLEAIQDTDQLIVSLCVRRSLRPDQIGDLSLDGYSFRLHIDYDAPVRIFDPEKTRDGQNYQAVITKTPPDANYNTLISEHHADLSAQSLYGGIISDATAISEEAILDFTLTRQGKDEQAKAEIVSLKIQGIEGQIELPKLSVPDSPERILAATGFKPGVIYSVAGVFDDPFIFPRFFRRSVVGIVTSIPLKALRGKDGRALLPSARPRPLLLWATTHKGGEQIDHVGRSLRTQLPRFGYLNDKHPSQHVGAIRSVHGNPSLLEGLEATFIAPLLAHRHYDDMPDVMIYDITKPAAFPNGRWLEDDVAKGLADAGETILLELAYAESREFPRATKNDKPFRLGFPFLAPRWTKAEVEMHTTPGTMIGDFAVPRAPDAGAIATPDLDNGVWRSVWLGEILGIISLTFLCVWKAHRNWLRLIFLILAALICYKLKGLLEQKAVPLDTNYFTQPAHKELLAAAGAAFGFALLLSFVYLWGRRRGVASAAAIPANPPGLQEQNASDDAYANDYAYQGSSFNEVRKAVFTDPYYGPVWTKPGTLPVHEVTFSSVAKGIFSRLSKKYFPFGEAAQRTISSHADLRWGKDRRGVKRLLHPNGICLTGKWKINPDADHRYTGGFTPGTDCLIVGRYSTCCTETRSGHTRSLSLVGKLYPEADPAKQQRTKGFITQEDIGGSITSSIFQGVTFNAPDVTPHRRGFGGIFAFLVTVVTFIKTDREPSIRQLYEIAELGVKEDELDKIVCPKFMRLTLALPHPDAPKLGTDFRDEILSHIYRPDGSKKQSLIFDIAVADEGEVTGKLYKKLQVPDNAWKTIGQIVFEDAVVSPNGDFVIHFHHPAWRTDLRDSHSATGPADSRIVRLLKWLIP